MRVVDLELYRNPIDIVVHLVSLLPTPPAPHYIQLLSPAHSTRWHGSVRSASQYGNRRGNRHGRPERIMSATTLLPDDDEAIDDLQRKIRVG